MRSVGFFVNIRNYLTKTHFRLTLLIDLSVFFYVLFLNSSCVKEEDFAVNYAMTKISCFPLTTLLLCVLSVQMCCIGKYEMICINWLFLLCLFEYVGYKYVELTSLI